MNIKLIVTLPKPAGLTKSAAREYVRAAVEGWVGGCDPDHPLFGQTHNGQVRVSFLRHPLYQNWPSI